MPDKRAGKSNIGWKAFSWRDARLSDRVYSELCPQFAISTRAASSTAETFRWKRSKLHCVLEVRRRGAMSRISRRQRSWSAIYDGQALLNNQDGFEGEFSFSARQGRVWKAVQVDAALKEKQALAWTLSKTDWRILINKYIDVSLDSDSEFKTNLGGEKKKRNLRISIFISLIDS